MKRMIKVVSLVLALIITLSVPVLAREEATPYASLYFAMYSTYMYRTSGTSFEIWFEVDAKYTMVEIGVSSIVVERSIAGGDWTAVKTYTPDDYPNMLCSNTISHTDHVVYTGLGGCDYRAYVTFYASNGNGYGERYVYADFI